MIRKTRWKGRWGRGKAEADGKEVVKIIELKSNLKVEGGVARGGGSRYLRSIHVFCIVPERKERKLWVMERWRISSSAAADR